MIRLNLSQPPHTLDPRQAHTIRDLSLMTQLYEGLLRHDSTRKLMPALASSYSISEDGCRYIFFLREAFWSNGEPITAYDFERSLKELLSPSFPTNYAFILFPVKNAKAAKAGDCSLDQVAIKALDRSTLSIELTQPTPQFLELTAFPTLFPVAQKGVWSGPFIIKEMQFQYSLVLEKNPLYWDHQQVTLDEIHFLMLSDPHTEALLFEQDEIDWLGQPLSHAISPEVLSSLEEKESYAIAGGCWLSFNQNSFPLDHVKVRKALSMAINREELITHVLQGGQSVATTLLPPSLALHKQGFFPDSHQQEAKRLLKEASSELGLESFPTLTLAFPTSHRSIQLAQAIQQQIKTSLGISLRLEVKEPTLFRQGVKESAFDIAYGEWIADYHDPIAFLELFLREPFSKGVAKERQPFYASLLQKASTEQKKELRLTHLQEAERLLFEEMAISPLYHYSFEYAKKARLQGALLSPLGLVDFKYTYIAH